jgi:hypothetical protein
LAADQQSQSANQPPNTGPINHHNQLQDDDDQLGDTLQGVRAVHQQGGPDPGTEVSSNMFDLCYLGDYENLDDLILGGGGDTAAPAPPRQQEREQEVKQDATLSLLPTLRIDELQEQSPRQEEQVMWQGEEEEWERHRGARRLKRLVSSDWEWKLGVWEAGEGRLHSYRLKKGQILLESEKAG